MAKNISDVKRFFDEKNIFYKDLSKGVVFDLTDFNKMKLTEVEYKSVFKNKHFEYSHFIHPITNTMIVCLTPKIKTE